MQVLRTNSTSLAAYSTKKIEHQIKDIEHKQTSRLITTLHEAGVRRIVIGDVRDLRRQTDVGRAINQKLHQWVRPKYSFCIVPWGTTGGEIPYGQRTDRRWKRQKGTQHVRKALSLEVS
jgi:IS605 OrfB family transposase